MGEKLLRLMKSEGLTSSRLAEILGTGASNISHIISGRSKPGYDLLRKILLSFPQINPDCSTTKQCTARMKLRSGNNPFRPTFLRQNPQLPNILPVPLTKPISPEIRIPSTRSIRIGSLPEVLEIWHLLPCNESSSFIPIGPSKVLRRNRNKKPDRSSVLKFAGHG